MSLPTAWPTERAKWLLERQSRPPRADDGVVTAFRDGQVTLRANRRIDGFTEAIQEIGYQGIRKGDLVVHSMDGFAGAIGISDSVGKASPVVHAYRVTAGADARFIAYFLRAMAKSGYIESLAKGIRERSTSFDAVTLANLQIPCPPLGEQRRIADFLDAETARIDGLQRARDRQLDVLGELVASRISALVPSKQDASFVRLGYLAVIQSGVTVDGRRDSGSEAVTLPYLRVANVQDGRLDLESITEITIPSAVAQSSMLRSGDVLMTEGGDLDKLGRGTVWNAEIEKCLHQNHVFAVRPDQGKLMPEYLALMTRTAHARAYFESTGTKTTNLASTSASKIRDFRIPLIAVPEQARMVRETESWLEEIARVKAILTLQRTLLVERRQALITAAVTGGMTV